jgi:hypothetical protein
MSKPFKYTFYDDRDSKNRLRYFVVSLVELSRVQQHKILNDYIAAHRYEHDYGGELVEIPLPPEIPGQSPRA